jgi:anti-anti-sigma factor
MPTATEIKACRTDGGYLIRVEGRGTMRESPAVREFAAQCLDQRRELTLSVDLSACEYLDSTFLGCLVGLYRRCQHEPQLHLNVCGDPGTRRRLLGATRLDTVFQCVEASPEPAGPWVPLSAPELEKRDFGLHVLECHERLSELECPSAPAFKAVAEQLARELGQSPGKR